MVSKKLSLRERLAVLFRGQLGVVHETEDSLAVGRAFTASPRDRLEYDRAAVLEDALDAWRFNPLARRIVGLTTQYVVGGGMTLTCKHPPTAQFIAQFWENRLNRMATRCYELSDELTRTGNLFVLLTTDAAGMSYLRAVPADQIERIDARPNDIEQPLRFWPKAALEDGSPQPYAAYDAQTDTSGAQGFQPVMLHYTINRPVGAQWGESDLAPVLKWLSRYSGWLEDRARLNRFRNSFLFVVRSAFTSEAERRARQATLAANPPTPGSILVCDQSESWEVISPKLEAHEAGQDGLSLKKMIASGVGLPMHFLAEPESATRTTAEAAGGPTYRHFEQRQKYFLWVLQDILNVVVARRSQVDRHISRHAGIEVRGADISARDNVALSMAAGNIVNALNALRDRNLIDNAEYLRLVYRFAGEAVEPQEMLARAVTEGSQPAVGTAVTPSGGEHHPLISAQTGELKPD